MREAGPASRIASMTFQKKDKKFPAEFWQRGELRRL